MVLLEESRKINCCFSEIGGRESAFGLRLDGILLVRYRDVGRDVG